MDASQHSLAGNWLGRIDLDDEAAPSAFEASIEDRDGGFHGHASAPIGRLGNVFDTSGGRMVGRVAGHRVMFETSYGQGSVEPGPVFSGVLNDRCDRIDGHWSIDGYPGTVAQVILVRDLGQN